MSRSRQERTFGRRRISDVGTRRWTHALWSQKHRGELASYRLPWTRPLQMRRPYHLAIGTFAVVLAAMAPTARADIWRPAPGHVQASIWPKSPPDPPDMPGSETA